MTPAEAVLAEYQQTIIDLGNRLARHASLIATLQAQNEELKKEVEALKAPPNDPGHA